MPRSTAGTNGTSLVIGISKIVFPRSFFVASNPGPGGTNFGMPLNASICLLAPATSARPEVFFEDAPPPHAAARTGRSATHRSAARRAVACLPCRLVTRKCGLLYRTGRLQPRRSIIQTAYVASRPSVSLTVHLFEAHELEPEVAHAVENPV